MPSTFYLKLFEHQQQSDQTNWHLRAALADTTDHFKCNTLHNANMNDKNRASHAHIALYTLSTHEVCVAAVKYINYRIRRSKIVCNSHNRALVTSSVYKRVQTPSIAISLWTRCTWSIERRCLFEPPCPAQRWPSSEHLSALAYTMASQMCCKNVSPCGGAHGWTGMLNWMRSMEAMTCRFVDVFTTSIACMNTKYHTWTLSTFMSIFVLWIYHCKCGACVCE